MEQQQITELRVKLRDYMAQNKLSTTAVAMQCGGINQHTIRRFVFDSKPILANNYLILLNYYNEKTK